MYEQNLDPFEQLLQQEISDFGEDFGRDDLESHRLVFGIGLACGLAEWAVGAGVVTKTAGRMSNLLTNYRCTLSPSTQ
jgi:hypothetical protein